jgi:NAD+ kinase
VKRAPSILIVYKLSNLDSYMKQGNHARVRRLIGELRRGHEHHASAVATVRACLARLGLSARFVRRDRLRAFDDKNFALVMTVGGDGTLLSTAPFVRRTPVLAVNSAPQDSVGFFAAADAHSVERWIDAIFSARVKPHVLSRMALALNGQRYPHPILNDVLFAHPSPGATTRLWLRAPEQRDGELQKCSGVWVTTASGSTGAVRSAGGAILPLASADLAYLVREPYLGPRGEAYQFTNGVVAPGQKLLLECRMQHARLWIDGRGTNLALKFGDRVTFFRHASGLRLFGYSAVMRALHGVS